MLGPIVTRISSCVTGSSGVIDITALIEGILQDGRARVQTQRCMELKLASTMTNKYVSRIQGGQFAAVVTQ